MQVSTVAEMRALDRLAIDQFGIPEEILMENAGLAVFSVLNQEFAIPGRKILVISGGGNNGADGLVAARKIHSAGGDVAVLLLCDPALYGGAARMNYEAGSRLPIPILQINSLAEAETRIAACDVIVDAVFGTGLTRPVEGLFKAVILAVNAAGKPVVSVDIPSGINGDTGLEMGAAVQADLTVTFGLPKVGNLLYPGYAKGGKLFVSHISFPPQIYRHLSIQTNTPPPFPPRQTDGHKGDFGDALFIAGAASYFGAPFFSASAFLKAGGGYARLAAPVSIVPTLAAKASEIVYLPQAETSQGSLSLAALPGILEAAEKVDFVVMGPGLSLDAETRQLVRELTSALQKPLLIDGDGISAICGAAEILARRTAPTVLTPHGGEMARLTGLRPAEINADRIAVLRRACAELQARIVLKGAHTLIGYPDGRVYINMNGNSGMASAGSGDVLTGTIAAAAGLGLPFDEAVRKGVYLHGLAGDLAARTVGEDGLTASDILSHLPAALVFDRRCAAADLMRPDLAIAL